MKMAAVLLGEPHCTTATVQEWAAPLPGRGKSAFYHIFLPHLVGQAQATTKEAGKYPLYSGETD